MVQADEVTLQSAIQNLIENAILYNNKADKTLSLTLKKEGKEVLLFVDDNGPGISDKDKTQ